MIQALCGSKSVEKILLFLFINRTLYPTQLHRLFCYPLTPIQKALTRLEKAQIVVSYIHGKMRLYHFNPSYPLLDELEALLKKAYALLSPTEKKQYLYIKQEEHADSNHVLYEVWKSLLQVSHLTFSASSKSKDVTGWNGKGKAVVTTQKESDSVLIFHEKGSWLDVKGNEIDFTNVFRWTLDRKAKVISLEHLRHGAANPVFLFHLAPSSEKSLSSIDSHLCNNDAYFGQITCSKPGLKLFWRVLGPNKNEEIQTYYT